MLGYNFYLKLKDEEKKDDVLEFFKDNDIEVELYVEDKGPFPKRCQLFAYMSSEENKKFCDEFKDEIDKDCKEDVLQQGSPFDKSK